MKTTLKFEFSDLASRSSARAVRLQVEELVKDDTKVELDLSNVESISDSYGDELFGILAIELGLEKFTSAVRLINAKEDVLVGIANNIQARLKQAIAA